MKQPRRVTYTHRIDARDTIRYLSPEWLAFAADNAAPELTRESVIGKPLWSFIAGEQTRLLYQMVLDKVRSARRPISIPFHCDSPSLKRYMRLEISSLAEGEIQFDGLLIREEPRVSVAAILDRALARRGWKGDRKDGLLSLCGWCKCVRLADAEWVDVESAIERLELFGSTELPDITHGICPTCEAMMREKLEADGGQRRGREPTPSGRGSRGRSSPRNR